MALLDQHPSKTPVVAATTKAYSLIKSEPWFFLAVCAAAFWLPVILLDLALLPGAISAAEQLGSLSATATQSQPHQLGSAADYLTLLGPMAEFAGRYLLLSAGAAILAAVGYWSLVNKALGQLGLRPPLTAGATVTDALWAFMRYGMVFYTCLGLVIALTGSLFLLPILIAAIMLAAPVLILSRQQTFWQSLVSAATLRYPSPKAGRKVGIVIGWLTVFVSYVFCGQMVSYLSAAATSQDATRLGLSLGVTATDPGALAFAWPILADGMVSALLAVLTGFLAVVSTCYVFICQSGGNEAHKDVGDALSA